MNNVQLGEQFMPQQNGIHVSTSGQSARMVPAFQEND
jgi:hypothetical protein